MFVGCCSTHVWRPHGAGMIILFQRFDILLFFSFCSWGDIQTLGMIFISMLIDEEETMFKEVRRS